MPPSLNTIERSAMERGWKRGLLECFPYVLEMKFGKSAKRVMPRVQEIHDLDELRALLKAILAAETLQEIRDRLPPRGK